MPLLLSPPLCLLLLLLLACTSVSAFILRSSSLPLNRLHMNAAAEEDSSSPLSSTIFCVNVNLHVKPERRADFIEVIRINQEGSRTKEKLCKQYLWGESSSTANIFHFQEQFFGEEGFLAHQKSEHFAVWERFVASDPFTRPPEVFLFEEANASLK